MHKTSWSEQISGALALRKERTKELIARMKERRVAPGIEEGEAIQKGRVQQELIECPIGADCDLGVVRDFCNEDLIQFVNLIDQVCASDQKLHVALFWPHIPPPAILPWMLREVSRGRGSRALRTLFVNAGRAAISAVAGLEARTDRLRARGVVRSGAKPAEIPEDIAPDAHFYMLLGDKANGGCAAVPLISIVPHSVALNDGTFWRDFDEKTLKGFKRLYPAVRLNAIRKYVEFLSSADRSPSFAFLLPQHFPARDRREALRRLPGAIDLTIIDMTTAASRGQDASSSIRDLVAELEECLESPCPRVLVLTDSPLQFSFVRAALKGRRQTGSLGTKLESHHLVWRTRGDGFDVPQESSPASRPLVETIASQECIVATRLLGRAKRLDHENPLATALIQAAIALKAMALSACSADAILAPYTDIHDAYHRRKHERHSFEPHYNKALALVGEGHAGPWREMIQADLSEGLTLAAALRVETPLMRYLRRTLTELGPQSDVLVVLRYPEDAQQASDRLLDFLTAPGSLAVGVSDLRITTPNGYAAALERRPPSVVIWAASPVLGSRAYIGDANCPPQFRLVVAGQDAGTLHRILQAVPAAGEYAPYRERGALLLNALPRTPKEFGLLSSALALDVDRRREAGGFVSQGYLLLDGYGKLSARPGSLFYVLDPSSHQLAPREARAIDVGDAVFVMPNSIRRNSRPSFAKKMTRDGRWSSR